MSSYDLSKNYTDLYKEICKGKVIAGFVDFKFNSTVRPADKPPFRDICRVKRYEQWNIDIGVRGHSYNDVGLYEKDQHITEVKAFVKACKAVNLEWIRA